MSSVTKSGELTNTQSVKSQENKPEKKLSFGGMLKKMLFSGSEPRSLEKSKVTKDAPHSKLSLWNTICAFFSFWISSKDKESNLSFSDNWKNLTTF
jgi:hypothetical protein